MSASYTKEEVAGMLERIASLLDVQDANVFRVRSYRQGARSIRESDADIVAMAERKDIDGLVALPDIGEGLAGLIVEYVTTGRSSLLEELQGQIMPETVIAQVPGIGDELAARIVDELGINTLEELEQAAYDGRLDQVEGFGEGRLKMVRTSLAGMLDRGGRRQRQEGDENTSEPPIALLVEIDAEYRRRAADGELPTIAPKRFNPDNEKWLPLLKTTRQGWKFTVLFSNTARAHELDKMHDWVVIYFEPEDGGSERQRTVVTEQTGPLEGKRVVRGREKETRDYYRQRQ
ncbi:MAG: helix-hairpin-helix domain-containing protein [Anaerolineae bacterium]|nr:helix-hairpin-helix domain-containing protein [Anaerolineae bacterium]